MILVVADEAGQTSGKLPGAAAKVTRRRALLSLQVIAQGRQFLTSGLRVQQRGQDHQAILLFIDQRQGKRMLPLIECLEHLPHGLLKGDELDVQDDAQFARQPKTQPLAEKGTGDGHGQRREQVGAGGFGDLRQLAGQAFEIRSEVKGAHGPVRAPNRATTQMFSIQTSIACAQ